MLHAVFNVENTTVDATASPEGEFGIYVNTEPRSLDLLSEHANVWQPGHGGKRKLFSSKYLGNLRANLRKGVPAPHLVEESAASSPDLLLAHAQQRLLRAALPMQLQLSWSREAQGELIPAHRSHPVPVAASHPERQPLNVQYPSLSGLELMRTLGTGSFGHVRLVRCCQTGQYLALKAIKKADVLRLQQLHRIANEKDILASLHHPFIVDLHAVYSDSSRLYMLMGYVPGGELFTHLQRSPRRRLPEQAARFYAASVLLALEYLHARHVVYRDLKPENILLDAAGFVKLADFGFAKAVHGRTYSLCGTPEYLAPEMIQRLGHGKGVDYWSLGILLYEMLVGSPPYRAAHDHQGHPGESLSGAATLDTYRRILASNLVIPLHVSAHARDLIRQLLKQDPAQRLGCLRGGALDVRGHPFFGGMDWDALLTRDIRPPIVPVVLAEGDAADYCVNSESADQEVPLCLSASSGASDAAFQAWGVEPAPLDSSTASMDAMDDTSMDWSPPGLAGAG